MKTSGVRFVLMILFVMTTHILHAQKGKLPPFKILQANGKVFTAHDLPMGKPILIVYFSPDCDHCEKMLNEFFKQSSGFQKASVAFITYLSVDKVSKFEKEYNLINHPNMYAGTEGNTFFVRNYYKITEMPFAALYSKEGNMILSYKGEVKLKLLSEKLKDLQ
jgi:thioredoxin-related protein